MAQIEAETGANSTIHIPSPPAYEAQGYYSKGPLSKEEILEKAPALRPPKPPEMSHYKIAREARK